MEPERNHLAYQPYMNLTKFWLFDVFLPFVLLWESCGKELASHFLLKLRDKDFRGISKWLNCSHSQWQNHLSKQQIFATSTFDTTFKIGLITWYSSQDLKVEYKPLETRFLPNRSMWIACSRATAISLPYLQSSLGRKVTLA